MPDGLNQFSCLIPSSFFWEGKRFSNLATIFRDVNKEEQDYS
jgi:hypothetical protein